MAKRVPALSALQITRARPHPTKTLELVDGAVAGFRLRLMPSGTKTWSLAMRANGVMRRFDVGSGLGLAEARVEAEQLRRKIKEGADSTAHKRTARQKALSALEGLGTLGAVIDAYFTTGNGTYLNTGEAQMKHLKTFFAQLLAKPAIDIRSAQLQLTVDAPRQRVLEADELRKLLPTFEDTYGRCSMFLLLTAAQRSEAVHATWSQIDFEAKIWTIRGEGRKDTRTQAPRKGKPKETLVVPLSEQALNLLEDIRNIERLRRYRRGLPKVSPANDRIFVTESGGPLINWSRWLVANEKKSGVSGWTAHALRRTAATLAGDLGAPPHVISAMLGHSNIGGQLLAGYNKS